MKTCITILAFLWASLAVAQTSEKHFFVSGSVSYWRESGETSFRIMPAVGYSFDKHWAAGVELSYASDVADNYSIAPFVRWTYFRKGDVGLFLDGTVGYSYVSLDGGQSSGWEIGLKPGLIWDLNVHFHLLAKLGFLGYRDNYRVMGVKNDGFGLRLSSETLSLGMQFSF